jgi:hypothetical protein
VTGDVRGAWCATSGDAGLVDLARSKFANLTPAELALLRFAGSNPAPGGGFAAAGPSANSDDPSNDPAHADEWSKDREVRAELIRWLCVDPEAIRRIDPQGLRLLGARIVGGLNLSLVRVPFAITLRNCSIANPMNLASAQIEDLDLSGSHTGPIHAESIEVSDTLRLSNGFHASGQVNLAVARIGLLVATNGHFKNSPDPNDPYPGAEVAIDLTGAQIKSSALMDSGFESQGCVYMDDATIAGDLICISGRFIHPGKTAIEASQTNIGGTVYLLARSLGVARSRSHLWPTDWCSSMSRTWAASLLMARDSLGRQTFSGMADLNR